MAGYSFSYVTATGLIKAVADEQNAALPKESTDTIKQVASGIRPAACQVNNTYNSGSDTFTERTELDIRKEQLKTFLEPFLIEWERERAVVKEWGRGSDESAITEKAGGVIYWVERYMFAAYYFYRHGTAAEVKALLDNIRFELETIGLWVWYGAYNNAVWNSAWTGESGADNFAKIAAAIPAAGTIYFTNPATGAWDTSKSIILPSNADRTARAGEWDNPTTLRIYLQSN